MDVGSVFGIGLVTAIFAIYIIIGVCCCTGEITSVNAAGTNIISDVEDEDQDLPPSYEAVMKADEKELPSYSIAINMEDC